MDLQIIWNIIAMVLFTVQASMIRDLRVKILEQEKMYEGLRAVVMGEDD